MRFKSEFEKYAIMDKGISSSNLHRVEASMTPYVLEEREMRVTQIDIFSRLQMDRIIWIAHPIEEIMASIVQAQLMFLDNLEVGDIRLHISSGGGAVSSGLAIISVMEYINSDIATINTEMCASMAAVLLAAGTKGKRSSLRFSRTMIHQVSGGNQGTIQDLKISYKEAEKYNDLLFELLAGYTGKTSDEVKRDADRDLWLNPEEAIEYGLIDLVIPSKKKKN